MLYQLVVFVFCSFFSVVIGNTHMDLFFSSLSEVNFLVLDKNVATLHSAINVWITVQHVVLQSMDYNGANALTGHELIR